MSKLKVYEIDTDYSNDIVSGNYYDKDAVDVLLAEKDAEIEKLDAIGKRNQIAAQTLRKKMVHQKYKRCLAMVERCREKCEKHVYQTKFWHYYKWCKRWLKLADKFKEAE